MQTRFIPGIYNYCNGWCERCPKTDACLVFASVCHYEAVADGRDSTDPLDELGPPSPEVEAFMRELLEAQDAMTDDDLAEFERQEKRLDREVEEDPLSPLAAGVSRALHRWSASSRPAFTDPILIEAAAIAGHYGLMIGPKVSRALHGYYRASANGVSTPESDELDDANATTKMMLLGMEVLLPAVETLAQVAPRDRHLRLALVNLPVIRALLLERFPRAMAAVRPGWDDGAG